MKFKSGYLLATTIACPLAVGSVALADDITVYDVSNLIETLAVINDSQSDGDAAGDITIDPFDGEAGALVEIGEGQAEAIGYQYTEWGSSAISSSASMSANYLNTGPPQDYFVGASSETSVEFLANENVTYTLEVTLYSYNFLSELDRAGGYLENLDTGDITEWSVDDVGGSGSLFYEGTLTAGDSYRIYMGGFSMSPGMEGFAAGDDEWSGYTTYGLNFSTFIPLPPAALAGMLGLGAVVTARGSQRRRTA